MKREEIREGVKKILEGVFSELDHWDCSEECGHKVCLTEWRDKLIDELLSYLHSQGVMIRVDRELPKNKWQAGRQSHSTPHLCIGHDAVKEAQDDMIEAGYVAVEPLIKEDK